jgi:Aldehyde dehydrogenase family
VVGFAVVDTVDEAVELANNSDYSLTASIWTKSIDGINIAGRIRAGKIVSVFVINYLFLETRDRCNQREYIELGAFLRKLWFRVCSSSHSADVIY